MRKPKVGEIWENDLGHVSIVLDDHPSEPSKKIWDRANELVKYYNQVNGTFIGIGQWTKPSSYDNNGKHLSLGCILTKCLGAVDINAMDGPVMVIGKSETECNHNWKPTTISKDHKEWCTICGEKK